MKAAHDLNGLITFVAREEWRGPFEAVLSEHVAPALEEYDLEFDDLASVLDGQWAMTLWGCAFEDFLTRTITPQPGNIVDVYLKRRGWNEGAANRIYMRGLRSSVMSLYEVSEITIGVSFRARDLILGGEPVMVFDKSSSATLRQWDRIAARLIPRGEAFVLAGGLLPFSESASGMLLDGIKEFALPASAGGELLDTETLSRCTPLFSNAFLFDALPQLGFVRFPSGPCPEDAIVCDVVEGLIEGQDASAHVVDILPTSSMRPVAEPDFVGRTDGLEASDRGLGC